MRFMSLYISAAKLTSTLSRTCGRIRLVGKDADGVIKTVKDNPEKKTPSSIEKSPAEGISGSNPTKMDLDVVVEQQKTPEEPKIS